MNPDEEFVDLLYSTLFNIDMMGKWMGDVQCVMYNKSQFSST